MGGKAAANPLPEHLRGRKTMRGPAAGAYQTFTFFATSLASGVTDDEVGAIVLPYDCRIEEISATAKTVNGTMTFQVTDGTNDLMSADPAVTTAVDAVVNGGTTSPAALVAAQRNRSKGDRLGVDVTTVAGTVLAWNCSITVHVLGHANTDPEDD